MSRTSDGGRAQRTGDRVRDSRGAGPRGPRGEEANMRFGHVEVRPLGGGTGCLGMILFSVIASIVLTVLLNLLLR